MMPVALDQDSVCGRPPYPEHLVRSRRLPDGTDVTVRPIRPEDDAMEAAFIGSLSSEARYNRLLSARRLTPDEIRCLTRIDYDREMAFVAVAGEMRLLGVSRYVRDDEGYGAEFGIVVADAWQRRGVGSLLLVTLMQHAQSAGVVRLHGITLATNQAMQKLARRLGFELQPYSQDATLRRVQKLLGANIPASPGRAGAGRTAIAANDDGGTLLK